MNIICPSGFAGTARKLKAGDLQALADQMEDDDEISDSGLKTICNLGWEDITDTGPYRFMKADAAIKPSWDRMLLGDLIGALLQIRVGSFRHGAEYDFAVRCERCKKRFEWTIDLRKDILGRMQALPEDSKNAMLEAVPLRMTMHDGAVVHFHLKTVVGSREVSALRKQQIKHGERKSADENAIDTVMSQIVRVDDLDWEGNIKRKQAWVHNLSLDDLYDLIEAFEAADCGYKTDIEVRCTKPECRWEQKIDLPLQATFLRPSRRPELKKENGSAVGASSSGSSSHGQPIETGSSSASTTSAGSSTEGAGTASPEEMSSG